MTGRTATVCSESCAQHLLERSAGHSTRSNTSLFLHLRQFYLLSLDSVGRGKNPYDYVQVVLGQSSGSDGSELSAAEASSLLSGPKESDDGESPTLYSDENDYEMSDEEASSTYSSYTDDSDEQALTDTTYLTRRNMPFVLLALFASRDERGPTFRHGEKLEEWKELDYYGGFSRFMDYRDDDDTWCCPTTDTKSLKPPSPENHFLPGMRLEAVDRKNPGLACVATVDAVSDDHVLIYFDGWSHSYDYWCRYDSPEIQPAGTCARVGLRLNRPSWQDDRRQIWTDSGETWHGYVQALGVPIADSELFVSLVRPETGDAVIPLAEMCLRRFLMALPNDAIEKFNAKESSISPRLPASVRKQIVAARSCVWCGKPFLTGYKCVDAFTTQEMLSSEHARSGRTATTCCRRCGEALVYRNRTPLNDSNEYFFLYQRMFFVPPRDSASGQ